MRPSSDRLHRALRMEKDLSAILERPVYYKNTITRCFICDSMIQGRDALAVSLYLWTGLSTAAMYIKVRFPLPMKYSLSYQFPSRISCLPRVKLNSSR
ncbi:hypothetical protein BDR06DRAFT_465404 [Suillus hirtellus]|nr:hypothetical protein BDR06DRAFT_465404 [Suillus hirtellus]